MLNFCQNLTPQPQRRQTEIEANNNYWRKVFDIVTGKSSNIEGSGDSRIRIVKIQTKIQTNVQTFKILDIRLYDFSNK